MLEQVYETIQAILYLELPKNAAGNVVVYDREIKGWNLGDRKLKPATPSITFQGTSSSPKEIATGTYEIDHTISIKIETGNDTQDITESIILEMTRLMYEALLPHRQIWVLTKCPICFKKALSPQHFTIDHPAIFSSYAAQVVTEQSAIWSETHLTSMPDLQPSRIATVAFDKVMTAVSNNNPVSNLTAEAVKAFKVIIANKMRPIRLLYDVHVSEIKPSDGGIDKQTLHLGEFTLMSKETIRIPSFGPDNVATTAWSSK